MKTQVYFTSMAMAVTFACAYQAAAQTTLGETLWSTTASGCVVQTEGQTAAFLNAAFGTVSFAPGQYGDIKLTCPVTQFYGWTSYQPNKLTITYYDDYGFDGITNHCYITADLLRSNLYLAGKPVLARPESYWYRTRKFIVRNPFAVTAAAIVFLASITGIAAVLWEARAARNEARTSAEVQKFIQAIFETSSRVQQDPIKARQTTARELLDFAAGNIDRQLNNAPAAKEKMLEILADLYIGLGLDDKAVALNRTRVDLVKEQYGPSDPRVAAALCKLAGAMEASTAANGREAILIDASKILDSRHDFSSSTRADMLAGFAKVYKDSNQQKALDYANQAVTLYQKGPPVIGLAKALYDQAVLYALFSDYGNAEAAARESVAVARKAAGETTNSISEFQELLADLDARMLRYDAAKENYEAAFTSSKALNGAEHVDTIEDEVGLADFYARIAEYPESLRLMKEAWENCLKLRGPDDPYHTPQVSLMYASVLAKSGQFEAALDMISRAEKNQRQTAPGSRPLGMTLWWQASILANLGEYEKAKLYLNEAAELSKKTGFKLQLEYGLVRAAIAIHEKKWDEAANIIDTFLGPLHDGGPLSFALLNNLNVRAQLALSKNEPQTALRLAIRLSDLVTGDSNRKYLRFWEKEAGLRRGLAFLQMGDALRALQPLRRAVKLDSEMYAPESAEQIPAAAALGIAYLQTGSRAEAVRTLADIEAVQKHHPHLGDRFEVPLRDLVRLMAIAWRIENASSMVAILPL
ncbi:MAG: hypothetical protein JO323_10315 [Acidobacteriia bacterium]|nr:hypothetical protein [Terriglobia bacterium]